MNNSQRRRIIMNRDPTLRSNAWAWGNWVKNKFRKASEIDFTHNGYCAVAKVKTAHGDIFCLTDRSPIIIRKMRTLIVELYKASDETVPIFVDRHIFGRIKAVENG